MAHRSFIKRGLLLGVFTLVMLAGHRPVTAVSSPRAAAQTIWDWRYGVVESYEAPGHAQTLGAAWTRVRFQWAEVQVGGAGTWTAAVSDDEINGQVNAGRLVTGLLIGIPNWANENGLPRGLWLPHDHPDNAWAAFVRTAVSRYDGRINRWIIWNEPDVWDTNAPGHTWDGSVEDFAQLLRVAYLAAKETNPNSVIHLPAFTYFWDANYGRDQYFNRLLDVIVADPGAADHNFYFDVVTAHLYFSPDNIHNIILAFHAMRANHGIPYKPLWLVETNAPPIDDPAWPVPNWTLAVTQADQASFMPQMMVAALAAGAERIAVFKLKDTAGDVAANPEPFGLVRFDGTRRPGYTTYRLAMQYLARVEAISRSRWDSVGQFHVTQPGRTTDVLFARLPGEQTAQVPAVANQAWLVDMWGSRQVLTAVDGFFEIELPGALCTQPAGDYCMIGGTVYYLIQDDDGGGPPDPEGLVGGATASDDLTSTPLPTAAATMTATATATATRTPSPTPSATATLAPSPTTTPSPTAPSPATISPATPTPEAVLPATSAPTPVLVTEPAGNAIWPLALAGALAVTVLAAVFVLRRRS